MPSYPTPSLAGNDMIVLMSLPHIGLNGMAVQIDSNTGYLVYSAKGAA
jgi:hypothetical protein